MTYANLLRLYDRQALEGCHYAVKTRWLADLTPEIISAVVSAGATRTSSFSVIALHHFHGPHKSPLMRPRLVCGGSTF
jgi:hypothetical protein